MHPPGFRNAGPLFGLTAHQICQAHASRFRADLTCQSPTSHVSTSAWRLNKRQPGDLRANESAKFGRGAIRDSLVITRRPINSCKLADSVLQRCVNCVDPRCLPGGGAVGLNSPLSSTSTPGWPTRSPLCGRNEGRLSSKIMSLS